MVPPHHVVPGVQDLAVRNRGTQVDDIGQKEPGPRGVLCVGVRDQVGDKCRRKLVLFRPDGEGPAEIVTEERKKTKQNRK